MAITVNLRYIGKGGAARQFAEEMTTSGTVWGHLMKVRRYSGIMISFRWILKRHFALALN